MPGLLIWILQYRPGGHADGLFRNHWGFHPLQRLPSFCPQAVYIPFSEEQRCICLKYTSITNCISNTLVWWNSNEIPSQIRTSGAEVGHYPLGIFRVWKTTVSASPVNFVAQNFTILINLEMWLLMQICSNLSICEFFLKNIWVWWTVKFWHALIKHEQECLLK